MVVVLLCIMCVGCVFDDCGVVGGGCGVDVVDFGGVVVGDFGYLWLIVWDVC